MLTALIKRWKTGFSFIRQHLDYLILGILSLSVLGALFYSLMPQTVYQLKLTPLSASSLPVEIPSSEQLEAASASEQVIDTSIQQALPKKDKKSKAHHAHTYAKKQLSIVNINQANVTQLQSLPGVGPKMALRILDYRKAHGSFQSSESLLEISGIGEKKLAKMKPYLKF